MEVYIHFILLIILFVGMIISKIIGKRKNKVIYNYSFFQLIKKLKFLCYIFSFILFFITLFIQFQVYGLSVSNKEAFIYLLYAFSISFLAMPFIIDILYFKTSFKEDKLCYIQLVITNLFDEVMIKKLNKSGIQVIVLNKKVDGKNRKIILPIIEEKDLLLLSKEELLQNRIVKTDNLQILNEKVDKAITCYWWDDLGKLYNEIRESRGIYDNYIRSVKYVMTIILSLLFSYFCLHIMGFPNLISIFFLVLVKVWLLCASLFIYNKMPYDTDIMERLPMNRKVLFTKQDILFLFIQSFIILFVMDIPYMFVLAEGGTKEFANTLFYIIFIYVNLFITFSYVSEANLFKNMIKGVKNKRLLLFTICCILITISLLFCAIFGTNNIGLLNYGSCVVFGLIGASFNELVKFARYRTLKGKKKNAIKNN